MNRNIKLITLFLVFATLTTMALGISKAFAPATGNMLIKIYLDPVQEENSLGKGDIDINDWPLSKTFITTYASDPKVTMNEYAEIGKMQMDINDQLWPTGPITSPRTGAKNGFFDSPGSPGVPNGPRDLAALHFRRAIAHLCNKAKYTTTFMGGYGYVMETIVPIPALEGFTDYSTLTNSTANADPWSPGMGGYLYAYDRAKAATEFELGGFEDWDGDTKLEWNLNYPAAWVDASDTEELPNMKLWARLDDPNRRQAGTDLYQEMVLAGIPAAASSSGAGLWLQIAERSSCFAAAMVNYDYNIYTGGWSMTADVDWIFDFMHSSMGQYGYANNYPGFKCYDFDAYAMKVKYPATLGVVRFAAIQAQWVMQKYCPIVDLWAAKGVKGYRTGYENVVNYAGFGTDNGYSFDLMSWNSGLGGTRNGDPDTIVYGFKSDISALSAITSEWLWDWNVLGLIYDSMIARNPYNLAEEVGALATSWVATDSEVGWEGKTVCTYTIRTGATFHDGSPVKPADIAYSLLLVKNAGAGNAWNYATVMDIDHVNINGNTLKVYFGVKSAWALHWAGFMPIVSKDLWHQAVGSATYGGYQGFIPDDTNGNYGTATFANGANLMRNYRIWEHTDMGNTGVNDLEEDGSYSWIYKSYVVGQAVNLDEFTGMYTTVYRGGVAMERSDFVTEAFNGVGNVNYDGGYGDDHGWYTPDRKIDLIGDLGYIAFALNTKSTDDWGSTSGKYNPDADLNRNNEVNVIDLATAGINFNKKMG